MGNLEGVSKSGAQIAHLVANAGQTLGGHVFRVSARAFQAPTLGRHRPCNTSERLLASIVQGHSIVRQEKRRIFSKKGRVANGQRSTV